MGSSKAASDLGVTYGGESGLMLAGRFSGPKLSTEVESMSFFGFRRNGEAERVEYPRLPGPPLIS